MAVRYVAHVQLLRVWSASRQAPTVRCSWGIFCAVLPRLLEHLHGTISRLAVWTVIGLQEQPAAAVGPSSHAKLAVIYMPCETGPENETEVPLAGQGVPHGQCARTCTLFKRTSGHTSDMLHTTRSSWRTALPNSAQRHGSCSKRADEGSETL